MIYAVIIVLNSRSMTRIVYESNVKVVTVFFLFPLNIQAHSLGVDKAVFKELPDNNYQLSSFVPSSLSHLITTVVLPEKCAFNNSPRGVRGDYEVRFDFVCNEPLNANDELLLPWKREGTLFTIEWLDADSVSAFVNRKGNHITIKLENFQANSGSLSNAAIRYTILGYEHIIKGIDHLLFVLALLLVVGANLNLVKTITAFTVAHSITLGLATLGYISLPSAPVEASIALSIVFLCIEILKYKPDISSITYRYPWLIAFIFGLLHGLGFAGALSGIGIAPSEIPVALLFFNIGVEIGQIVFVTIALIIGYILKYFVEAINSTRLIYFSRIFLVYTIGSIAVYWLVERSSVFLPI